MKTWQRISRSAVLLACTLVLLVSAGSESRAQSPSLPAVLQNGINWLTAQVQADGSLAQENASIATPLQARQEAASILAKLTAVPAPLANAVAADVEANVEYMARRVIAATGYGQSDLSDVSAIL